MIIPISIEASSSSSQELPPNIAKISHDEVVLIELQGNLHCSDDHEREGKLVGKLTVDDSLNKPTLLIGHHLLEGKVVKLSKPLAVMTRKNERGVEWSIMGIVKRKLVFAKRPTPV